MRHRFLLDILSGAFIETSSKFAGRLFARPGVKGAYPGVETPITPDEPDDSTPVMGFEVVGLATGSSSGEGWGVGWCSNSCCSDAAYYRTACPPLRCEDASPIAGAWPPVASARDSRGPIDAVT